jgi:hypothetical protein
MLCPSLLLSVFVTWYACPIVPTTILMDTMDDGYTRNRRLDISNENILPKVYQSSPWVLGEGAGNALERQIHTRVYAILFKSVIFRLLARRSMSAGVGVSLPVKCTFCEEGFQYKKDLANHLLLVHGVKAAANEVSLPNTCLRGTPVHQCPFCEGIFSSIGVLKSHIKVCKDHVGISSEKVPVIRRSRHHEKPRKQSAVHGLHGTTRTKRNTIYGRSHHNIAGTPALVLVASQIDSSSTTAENKMTFSKCTVKDLVAKGQLERKTRKHAGKKKKVKKKTLPPVLPSAFCILCASDAPADLQCQGACKAWFHFSCVGRIAGLIPNVTGWTCAQCGPENAEKLNLNFSTCFVCGVGGNLVCCENCPRAFHLNCSGVHCGLRVVRPKTSEAAASTTPDWCRLCQVASPRPGSDGVQRDIFAVTTNMRYNYHRALDIASLEKGVFFSDYLRYFELIFSASFFEEVFDKFWIIWHHGPRDHKTCANAIFCSIANMMGCGGYNTMMLALRCFKESGSTYANAFGDMGGRGYGWQMCTGCNEFRILRTRCMNCGKNYRKDLSLSREMSCEAFLFIPEIPKKIENMLEQYTSLQTCTTFKEEKNIAMRRALHSLMVSTHNIIKKQRKKCTTLLEIGTIVFLHYQAYVNLKDESLKAQALENFKGAVNTWLETAGTFTAVDSDDEEFEENLNKSVSILLDCTQGLCALRWAMCHDLVHPCVKHGKSCPFVGLTTDPSTRPYDYVGITSNEASPCPYERALQLEYQASLVDEGEFYNDSSAWDYDGRYPITPVNHCMRCDRKWGKKNASAANCCDGMPPLRTIDYSTCYDYLIWGYCSQVIGIDAFKFNLKSFVKKLPVLRSYGTFEELGHRCFLHQCYFITHFIYAMSEWGRYRLCINKFWEEYAFIVENIKLVANHIQDFEVLGEFLNCLGIIGVASKGEERIANLVKYGQATLLHVERVRFKKSGQWVSRATKLKDQYHSAWCGLVGLTEYNERLVGNELRASPPLRIPCYFLGLSASYEFAPPTSRTAFRFEIVHNEDAKESLGTIGVDTTSTRQAIGRSKGGNGNSDHRTPSPTSSTSSTEVGTRSNSTVSPNMPVESADRMY